jgi:DegV family protein with EDD domain
MLVYLALKKRAEGSSIEELVDYVENTKNHLCHIFTVDDLFHLYRGGRLSIGAAVIGAALQVKPTLIVDTEGRLIPTAKVMGRKQALKALVDKMKEKSAGYQNEVVFIAHGDSHDDANFVAERGRAELGIQNIVIDYVGPIIGAHTGPGMVSLFFLGVNKEK